jgi:hypothetical protein
MTGREEVRCSTCAASSTGGGTCMYCRAPSSMLGQSSAEPGRSVAAAVDAWARVAPGAPRRFSALVTSVEVHDDIVHRICADIQRRDIREERAPSNARQRQAPRLNPHAVDPWRVSIQQLRTDSEYVALCDSCQGSGVAACGSCNASGRCNCHGCKGSGQELRVYKKSSRMVKCTVCRGAQTVLCGGCGGRGAITCVGCTGTGSQNVWLSYTQTPYPFVSVGPWNPGLGAHPHLAEKRPLASGDVPGLTVVYSVEDVDVRSRLAPGDREFVEKSMPTIDPRLDRVLRQQYMKLAMIRRDAIYSLCGVVGRVVLSGRDLLPAENEDSLRPIKRYKRLWRLVAALIGIGAFVLTATFLGHSSYFFSWNKLLWLTWLVGSLLSTLAIRSCFRELGSKAWFGRLNIIERCTAISAPVCFALLVILALLARPRIAEVGRAIQAGQLDYAQTVVDALLETKGRTPEVRETIDAVLLARADTVRGDRRISMLDEVASHAGTRASEAALAARKDRIVEIEKLLANNPSGAIAKFEQWFGKDTMDAELAELRARLSDGAFEACKDDVCRLREAVDAQTATVSQGSASRVEKSVGQLLGALSFAESPNEAQLQRLARLRGLAELASQVKDLRQANSILVEKAKMAIAYARQQRSKVPVLGSDEGVAAELLGPLTTKNAKVSSMNLDGIETYVVFDAQRKCRGLYLVGKEGARAIRSAAWSADRLLSQAVGAAVSLKKPALATITSRSWEVSAPVVARWKSGNLVELRIGDAAP